MTQATIVIHLPAHRQKALQIERDTRDAREAYDRHIGAYIDFLRTGADAAGYALTTDGRSDVAAYSIAEDDHRSKQAAHDWLATQPDIWNWMP